MRNFDDLIDLLNADSPLGTHLAHDDALRIAAALELAQAVPALRQTAEQHVRLGEAILVDPAIDLPVAAEVKLRGELKAARDALVASMDAEDVLG